MDLSSLKEIVKDLTQSAESRAVSRALKSYSKGQLDKAIEILTEAKAESPDNADILYDLTRYLVQANRGGEAAEALRSVLRRHPRTYQRASEMIEELRARHAPVTPLFDAVAEHFVRIDDFKNALEALSRMKQEEIRVLMPRHRSKWDGLRKSAPDAKMVKTSLHSAYYLALCHEALRDYDPAATIYRTVAKNNPEETPKILARLEALLAKDYQNAALRLAVGDLFLRSGRDSDAVQQFSLVLETDARGAGPVAERIKEFLKEKGEKHELRWILVAAHLAAKEEAFALSAIRPLVEAGALLNDVVPALESMAEPEKDKSGEARRLLATALARRGQSQSAVNILLTVAEERGLPVIRDALEAIVASDPRCARAYHLLADVHAAEQRGDEAVECLRKARALAPQEDALLAPRLTKILDAAPASPEAHLMLADLLIKGGERDRAIVILRHLVREVPASAGEAVPRFAAVLKDDPQAARARIGIAEAHLELQHFPESLEQLTGVATSRPELAAEFLRTVGLLAETSPDLHAGLADLLRSLENRTRVPHAVHFALGEALFYGGQLAGAATVFRDLLHAAPERTEEIRAALERFDRGSPEAAEARVLLAMLCLDRRDHQGALAELSRGGVTSGVLFDRVVAKFEEILAATPDDLPARVAFVEALCLGRRYDRVLSAGAETLKLRDDATTARVSMAMGEALSEKGDAGAAVKRYFAACGRDRGLAPAIIDRLRKLIEAEGSLPLASLALGKILGSEGRPAEAVEALRAARASDPKLSDTVLGELQRLKDAAPGDPQAALLMLSILAESGDHKRAVQVISSLLDSRADLASVLAGHLDRILKIDPQQAFATYEMGRALQQLNLHTRSSACYLAAFRLDATLAPMILKRLQELIEAAPTCPDPYMAACAIHAARGRVQAAGEKIEQALAKMPSEVERLLPRLEEIQKQSRGNASISLIYADACLRAGRHDKALEAFGEAAERDPAAFDRALEGVETIVKAAPKMGGAYLWRGRLHARRLRVDQAVADLQHAGRLDPRLSAQIIEAAESLRAQTPESHSCALLLADHYLAAGRDTEAARLLTEELERGRGRSERLSLLVRLWKLSAARGDDESARHHLAEAIRLSPDRNQFLMRVHETHLALLRASVLRLREHVDRGARRGADLQALLRTLLDLGRVREAATALDRRAAEIDPKEAARLRAEIALRAGEYVRACEFLVKLAPSRALAFAATRAGDHALSARTLEALIKSGTEPGLEISLARVYRDMVVADLMGGRRRLLGETQLTFGDEAAA